MMAGIEALTIPVELNPAPLRQGALGVRSALTAIEGDAKKSGQAMEASTRQAAGTYVDASGKMRDANGRFVTGQKEAENQVKGFGAAAGLSFSLVQTGISKLIEGMVAYRAATEAARREQERMAGRYNTVEGAAAEIANISGEKLDDKFIRKIANFGVQSGMTPEQTIAFTENVLNSGQQFVGTNIQKGAETEEFKLKLAQLAMNKGADPGVVGAFGGAMLGMSDFTKYGDQAAEMAAGRVAQSLDILSAGAGGNRQLADSMTTVMMSTMNENKALGIFQDERQIAAMISTIAQVEPGQTEPYSMAALKGLRKFDNPLIQKAGITARTPQLEAVRMLNDIVMQQSKDQDMPMQDVIAQSFPDRETQKGLMALTSQGIGKGLLKSRLGSVEGVSPIDSLNAQTSQYLASDRYRMVNRVAAEQQQAELERGGESRPLMSARQKAAAELTRERQLATTGSELQKGLTNTLSFGALPDTDQEKIDARINARLTGLAKAAGIPDMNLSAFGLSTGSQEDKTASFNSRTEALKSAYGVDYFAGDLAKEQADAAKRAAVALEQGSRRTMTKATPGGGAVRTGR
jgi:hypothetical protein